MDIPNQRSSHETPVPRGGGVGILLGLFAGWASLRTDLTGFDLYLLLGILIIAVVGLFDDMKGGLSPLLRLVAQSCAALIILLPAGGMSCLPLPAPLSFHLHWLSIPLGLIWIVGVTNIYNFLDGIDGYAGVQGLICGVALFVVLWPAQNSLFFLCLAGGCLGFLFHNWQPARIFMGDAGSASLGFIFGVAPFVVSKTGQGKAGVTWLVAMFLWFFLSDGLFTILKRVCKREKIWEAHRSHLYQRLVKSGASHSKVVVGVMIPALALSILAGWAWKNRDPAWMWIVFALAFLAFGIYWFVVTAVEKRVAADGG